MQTCLILTTLYLEINVYFFMSCKKGKICPLQSSDSTKSIFGYLIYFTPKKLHAKKVTEKLLLSFLRLIPTLPPIVDGRMDEQQTRKARRGYPECDSIVWFQAVNGALACGW